MALAGAVFIAPQVQADTLFGIYAGAGTWQQEYSGDIASGLTEVDVEADLGLDSQNNNVYYFALEHGVPVLPNIRAQYTDISVGGAETLSRTIDFNGTAFTLADDVQTNVSLTQTDLVLYYELLDNVVSLDLGLAARQVDGEIAIASLTQSARAQFDGIIPLAYAKARVDLPLSGFWLGAEAAGVSYSGDQLIDANAQVGWSSDLGLGIELGYRSFQLELEDFDEVSQASFNVDGPYAALNFHF